ncbi:unnamed protein product, partial [Ectocarpus fasciculatus]
MIISKFCRPLSPLSHSAHHSRAQPCYCLCALTTRDSSSQAQAHVNSAEGWVTKPACTSNCCIATATWHGHARPTSGPQPAGATSSRATGQRKSGSASSFIRCESEPNPPTTSIEALLRAVVSLCKQPLGSA